MKLHEVLEVFLTVRKMKINSIKWHKSGNENKKLLEKENQEKARLLRKKYGIPIVYDEINGVWNVTAKLYDLY